MTTIVAAAIGAAPKECPLVANGLGMSRALSARMNDLRGLDLVAQALKQEQFPCDKLALLHSVGDIEIEDCTGSWIAVRDVLERISENEFTTARDALHALCRAADRRRVAAA